jgi:hypothetical protein
VEGGLCETEMLCFWVEFPKRQLVKWNSGMAFHMVLKKVIVGNFALPLLAIVDFYHQLWK